MTSNVKLCLGCEQHLPLTDFYKSPSRETPSARCRSCHRAQTNAWKAANRQRTRDMKLRLRYGFQPGEYERRLAEQGNCCAICRESATERAMHVDHCHETGRVRAILCHLCNVGLGSFRDDPALLRAAADYLAATPKSVQGDGPSAVALHIVKEEPAA